MGLDADFEIGLRCAVMRMLLTLVIPYGNVGGYIELGEFPSVPCRTSDHDFFIIFQLL